MTMMMMMMPLMNENNDAVDVDGHNKFIPESAISDKIWAAWLELAGVCVSLDTPPTCSSR